MMISKYVTYEEAIKSQTAIRLGINNAPTETHLIAMKNVATKVFDVVREHFNTRLGISSFYRSAELNKKTPGSSKISQHLTGEAIDIDADMYGKITNAQIFEFVKNNLEFDQMIWEYGDTKEPAWVHVSLKVVGQNRKQLLRAVKLPNGKTQYQAY